MRKPKPEAVEPSYNDITLNTQYQTTRLGKTTYVYPVEIKGDMVKVKRDLAAADSASMSRAKFDRYYVPV